MSIPLAYQQLKAAQAAKDMPHLAKYPKIMKDYLEAALSAEWNMPNQCVKITTEMQDSMAVISFYYNESSPVVVKIAISELENLHGQISNMLGV